jgi:hypothetical protein
VQATRNVGVLDQREQLFIGSQAPAVISLAHVLGGMSVLSNREWTHALTQLSDTRGNDGAVGAVTMVTVGSRKE